jgi:3-deoxy-7-phosphoheptulonate synthase
MIDFSTPTASKQFKRQIDVARDVAGQMAGGEDRIFGVMIESHLKEGRQDLVPGKPLEYGQSITDACIGWEDSIAGAGNPRRSGKSPSRRPGRQIKASA